MITRLPCNFAMIVVDRSNNRTLNTLCPTLFGTSHVKFRSSDKSFADIFDSLWENMKDVIPKHIYNIARLCVSMLRLYSYSVKTEPNEQKTCGFQLRKLKVRCQTDGFVCLLMSPKYTYVSTLCTAQPTYGTYVCNLLSTRTSSYVP